MEDLEKSGQDEEARRQALLKEQEEFEAKMIQQQKQIEEDNKKAQAELEERMNAQLNDQKKKEQFAEVDYSL